MPERVVWTEDQDKILKHLREERGERKWATIARIMEQEFEILGRTGKQCRERYHNHLDSSIINTEWTSEEEQALFNLHLDLGNKWSTIAQKLPGRSDNCVKNHFYSKLRKAVRKLNKLITDFFNDQYKIIKNTILSQIIEKTQSRFKTSSKIDQQLAEFCNSIKNRLFKFQIIDLDNISHSQLASSKQLVSDIDYFQKRRRNQKIIKKKILQIQYKTYLKPPMLEKRQHSQRSYDLSDDGQFLNSSCSYISSCSDLSQYDNQAKIISSTASPNSPLTPDSFRTFSIRASQIQKKQERSIRQIKVYYNENENEYQSQNGMQAQQFQRQHNNLIQVEAQAEDEDDYLINNPLDSSSHYPNFFYENTPLIARILLPNAGEMNEQLGYELFKNRKDSNPDDIIQLRQQKIE